MRAKYFVFCIWLFISSAAEVFGQPSTTHIHDTVYDGGANPVIGSCTYWASGKFTGPSGVQVVGELVRVDIINGVIDFQIVPTDTAVPSGQYYNARCLGQGGWRMTGIWTVPTTGSVLTLPDIWTTPAPTPSVVIPLSQLGQVGTSGQAICSNGTSWVAGSCGGGGSQVNSDWNATTGVERILNKPTLGTAAAKNVGTGANDVSAGNHLHTGVYEAIDATLLRQANLAGSGSATTPARSDHNHTGTYQPVLGFTAQNIAEKGAVNGYASLNSSGRVPIGQLCSGTPDGTKFVRDDGVCVTVSGGTTPTGTPNRVFATDALGSSSNAATLRFLVDLDIPGTIMRTSAAVVTPAQSNKIPQADGTGVIDDGWMSPNIARMADVRSHYGVVDGLSSSTILFEPNSRGNDNVRVGFNDVVYMSGLRQFDNYANAWGRVLWVNIHNGRNAPDNLDKRTQVADVVNVNFSGGGQKFGRTTAVYCSGSGDCGGQDIFVYPSGHGTAWGDENAIGQSVRIWRPTVELNTPVTSSVQPSVNTTTTSLVTKSNSSTDLKTIGLATTTGISVGDWLTIDNGQMFCRTDQAAAGKCSRTDDLAEDFKVVGITAGTPGSVTAYLNQEHASGVPVKGARKVGIAMEPFNLYDNRIGQDRVSIMTGTGASSYSTGSIVSITQDTTYSYVVTGTGTSWSSSVVGGDAENPGCISFDQDIPSVGRAAGLRVWFPIHSMSGTTMRIFQYTGKATGGNYLIRQCSKNGMIDVLTTSSSMQPTHVVLRNNPFSWPVNADFVQTIDPWNFVQHAIMSYCNYSNLPSGQNSTPCGASFRAVIDDYSKGGAAFETDSGVMDGSAADRYGYRYGIRLAASTSDYQIHIIGKNANQTAIQLDNTLDRKMIKWEGLSGAAAELYSTTDGFAIDDYFDAKLKLKSAVILGSNDLTLAFGSMTGNRVATFPNASGNVVLWSGTTPADDECPEFAVSSGIVTLRTSGAVCGGGGGGGANTALSNLASVNINNVLLYWGGVSADHQAGIKAFHSGSWGAELSFEDAGGDLVFYDNTGGSPVERARFAVTAAGTTTVASGTQNFAILNTGVKRLGSVGDSAAFKWAAYRYTGSGNDVYSVASFDAGGNDQYNRLVITEAHGSTPGIAEVRLQDAHLWSAQGTAPGISGCGTGGTLSANGTDEGGTITLGTTPGSCVLTFHSAYITNAPKCTVTFQGGVAGAYSVTTSAITITATGLSGAIDYRCAQ